MNNKKLPFIPVSQRLSEHKNVTGCIFGKSGIGKTSLLWTLSTEKTLFFNLDAGDLAVKDWPGNMLRPKTWKECLDFAVLIGGANHLLPNDMFFSKSHLEEAEAQFGPNDQINSFNIIFIDSITAAGRLCFSWCKLQPQVYNEKNWKTRYQGFIYFIYTRNAKLVDPFK